MAINALDAGEEQRFSIPDVLPVMPLRGMVVFRSPRPRWSSARSGPSA